MFRSKLPPIGPQIALLGFAVLGLSLYGWARESPAHRLFYTENAYKWVNADSTSAPAIETDQIWRASASCQMPYFVGAALRAKAKLNAIYNAAPDEILEWRNRPARATYRLSEEKTDFQSLLARAQEEHERTIAETDYDSKLHVKYMEWYVTLAKFEEQVKQWERRLGNVADRTVSLSEARRGLFRPYASDNIEQSSDRHDLEHYALSILGLGGFSDEQLQAIKARCVNVTPVKEIVTKTYYHSDIWRWPIDRVATFWLGLELLILGMLFCPIARWISTGDVRTLSRHVRYALRRPIVRARSFAGRKSIFVAQIVWPYIREETKCLIKSVSGLVRSTLVFTAQTVWPHVRDRARRLIVTVRSLVGSKFVIIVIRQ